jgi:hypothetical protein
VRAMDEKLKLEKTLEDQNALRETLESVRSKSKDRPMFNALTEKIRRKISKKLVYENVTDAQFLEIRESVIAACKLRTAASLNESTKVKTKKKFKIKTSGVK